jgi:hypothetical protein
MSIGVDDVQNVYHLRLDTVSGSPTNEALLAEVATVMDTIYDTADGVISDLLTFDTIEVYNVTDDEYVGEAGWPTLTVGSNADITPPQCAPLVLFNTATLRSQGRKFLPPFGIGSADGDGTLTSAALTVMAAFVAEVLTPGGWTSYGGDFGNYRDIGGVFIEWTAGVVRDFFATQRRRYFGAGS